MAFNFWIFVLVATVLVLTWNFPPPTPKTLNLIGKIAGAVGKVWVKRFKKILDWFLVKIQRTITFALVIRITIILYAFGVEFDIPPSWTRLFRFPNSDSPENAIFYISAIFFVIFLHFFHFWKIVKNTCALSFDLIFLVLLFDHSKEYPTNFQVIWRSFEYTCSYTLCYANITRIYVFGCMTRGNPSELQPFDLEIDRTFHRGSRHLRNPYLHAEYSVTFLDS